ncbi:MAG TPA: MMPL family transporter [Rhizomicrobium sp.]|nr:MMPL family transporter [Rhizomicrobium sp.]
MPVASIVERVVAFCARNAAVVVLLALVVGLFASFYSATHFAMNSDPESLISSQTSWRKRNAQFDAEFPQLGNAIDVVIDGATPELAERGAGELAAELEKRPELFHNVTRPGGGSFFSHNGLLFLPLERVKQTAAQLITAQPFLGALASDPSLRGVTDSLSTALEGVKRGQANLASLERPIVVFGDTIARTTEGRPAFLAWQSLITGERPTILETRRFVSTQPQLEYNSLTPGTRATDEIRSLVRKLHLTPDHGIRVRLTGPVPLADEEFSTIRERAGLMTVLMLTGVIAMLWLAVRVFRLIFAILLTVFVGLVATAALGLLAIGTFNVISVAFIPLFVGLGVDFAIQFCVRYRAERHVIDDLDSALAHAGGGLGNALSLAAAATAAGFYSFLPTSYSGVAELGLIAGTGMLVTFGLSITLLPALLKFARPPGEPENIGYRSLSPLDSFLTEHRHLVMAVALALAAICAAALPKLHFDFNPLDLRNPSSESVATALDLLKDPETSPNTIDVLAGSRAAAARLTPALSALPAVSQVLTIDSFVPDNQAQKLALIRDADNLLDPTLNPFLTKPPPSDAETVAALTNAAAALRSASAGAQPKLAEESRMLADLLDRVAHGSAELRQRVTLAFVPGLQTMLDQLRAALTPKPVSFATLPADLKRDWVTRDGKYRIQVFPKGNANNNAVIQEFTRQVRIIAPEATGEPISIQESGRTIVRAFIQAGILSFLSITLLLALALRRWTDVAIALAPLVLAGILTLGTCVLIGLRMNFANIIALPLIFGIGVAFDIYFVMAWRSGMRRLLQSPLTRAVILSAGTTASAFGTLWISSHPGLASMGELLAISLAWILATVLFVLPALLAQATHRGGMPEVV